MEVARAAADGLKRVHLELGGKAPVIVFDDADVAATAAGIAPAAFFNAGQDCTAATRVLAGPGIAADLTDALAQQAAKTTVGGLDVPDADYGPLNNQAQLARVEGFLARRPATRGSSPAAPTRGSAATASRPPSWPGCARTTR